MRNVSRIQSTSWKIILVILVLFSANYLAQAQDQPGKFMHQVKAQETFYSLSKQYGVSIDEIKRANPGVEYPRVGDFLVIPGVQRAQEALEPEFSIYTTHAELSIFLLARMLSYPVDSLLIWNPGIPNFLPAGTKLKTRPPDPAKKFIVHTVHDDRSSLKDISQLYDINYRDLRDVNPEIKSRVWRGQEVRIPVMGEGAPQNGRLELTGIIPSAEIKAEQEPDFLMECPKDPRFRNRTYKVALMVPFSLETIGNIDTLVDGTSSDIMNQPAFRFIQFYQGFMLAADSLAKDGLKLELSVFDVDQDIAKANKLVHDPVMREMDMLIGPFYKNTFRPLAEFARENSIPIINPLSPREDIVTNNPEVFKVLPSRESLARELTGLVEQRFEGYNVVIVTENKYQGAVYVDSLRKTLSTLTFQDVPVVDYMTDSIAGVHEKLDTLGRNLVIIYAENEVLPVEIMPLLTELRKKVDITIAGIPEWRGYEHLENKYLQALGSYIFSSYYVDYSIPAVKKFLEVFRSRYLAEPLEYAFDGFDIGYYFLSALMNYGPECRDCLQHESYPLLHTRFKFKKVPDGGFENTYWNIYYYWNFERIQVPVTQNIP